MLRHQTKTFAGLVTLACTAALLSLPTESVGQDIGFKDWTYDSYGTMSQNIWKNFGLGGTSGGEGMSNSWNRPGMPRMTLKKPDVLRFDSGRNKVQYKMTYNFGYADPTFGTDGVYRLLDTKNTGRSLYNISSDWRTRVGGSQQIADASSQLNSGTTPWLAVAGENKTGDELYRYLTSGPRKDQWSLTNDQGNVIRPWDDDVKNPYRRTAAALGMSYNLTQHNHQPLDSKGNPTFGGYHYSNNYVVTMWVDEDAFYRPNGIGDILNTTAESAEFTRVIDPKTGESYWDLKDGWNKDWPQGLVGGNYVWPVDADLMPAAYPTLSDFYRDWWENNDPKGQFPWTGIGYTYDWYYQNANGTGWNEYWSQDPSENGNYYFGQGVSEFVMLQSDPFLDDSSSKARFEVIDVQTTYQYLDGQNGPWGLSSVPEPTTLTIFGMAALAGLGMHRRRRR